MTIEEALESLGLTTVDIHNLPSDIAKKNANVAYQKKILHYHPDNPAVTIEEAKKQTLKITQAFRYLQKQIFLKSPESKLPPKGTPLAFELKCNIEDFLYVYDTEGFKALNESQKHGTEIAQEMLSSILGIDNNSFSVNLNPDNITYSISSGDLSVLATILLFLEPIIKNRIEYLINHANFIYVPFVSVQSYLGGTLSRPVSPSTVIKYLFRNDFDPSDNYWGFFSIDAAGYYCSYPKNNFEAIAENVSQNKTTSDTIRSLNSTRNVTLPKDFDIQSMFQLIQFINIHANPTTVILNPHHLQKVLPETRPSLFITDPQKNDNSELQTSKKMEKTSSKAINNPKPLKQLQKVNSQPKNKPEPIKSDNTLNQIGPNKISKTKSEKETLKNAGGEKTDQYNKTKPILVPTQEKLKTKSKENLKDSKRENHDESENSERDGQTAKDFNINRPPVNIDPNTNTNNNTNPSKTVETPSTKSKPQNGPSESQSQKKSEEEIKRLELARKKLLVFLNTGLKQNFEKLKQLADNTADECVSNFYTQLSKRKEDFFKTNPGISNYSTYMNNLKKDINEYKPELKKLGIWDKVKPFVMGILGILACLPLGIPALIISRSSKKGFRATFFKFKKREPEKLKEDYDLLKKSFNQFLLESDFLLSPAIEQIEKPLNEHRNIPTM